MNDVTRNEYNNLAHAYDYLNEQLFGSALPDCLITLKRDRPGHLGHYQSMVVRSRTDQKATDEISLNIASFACEQNAWAKPESKLICGDCMEVMESEDNQESADD